MTAQDTIDRATAPRVGDVFVWRDSRVTVKCVAADGTVSTLVKHENLYSDASCSSEEWRKAVATVMRHDGVTFTPALDTAAAGVVQCAT